MPSLRRSRAARTRQKLRGAGKQVKLIELARNGTLDNLSNEQIGVLIGCKRTQVAAHLKVLKDCGTITIHTSKTGWTENGQVRYRTKTRSFQVNDAIPKSQVSQQGNPQPGSKPPEANPPDYADVFGDCRLDTGTWGDAGSN